VKLERLEYSTVLISNVDFPTFFDEYPGLRHSNQGDFVVAFCDHLIRHRTAPPSHHTLLQCFTYPKDPSFGAYIAEHALGRQVSSVCPYTQNLIAFFKPKSARHAGMTRAENRAAAKACQQKKFQRWRITFPLTYRNGVISARSGLGGKQSPRRHSSFKK
jgi:hypothetical protein